MITQPFLRTILSWVLLPLFSLRADSALADKHPSDIWLVSTRNLPRPRHQSEWEKPPNVWMCQDGSIERSSLDELFASHDPTQVTCVFVHGNRMSWSDAQGQGLCVYDKLVRSDRPCRYIIWSWPSDKTSQPLRDARSKADRADGDSLYLATFLASLSPNSKVVMIGYSFGSRLVTGSAHLLAGGTIHDNCLRKGEASRVRPRAILLASAFPCHWLLPGNAHGLALSQIDHVTLFHNRRDPVLCHYHLIFKSPRRVQALGYGGISTAKLGALGVSIDQYDVTNKVGSSHSLFRFVDSTTIMETIRRHTFLE